jgi:Tfp pilus assembly protein PilF
MKPMQVVVAALLIVVTWGCAANKPKPRVPLPLMGNVSQAAQQANTLGTSAYGTGQFDQAKSYFEQAVSGAPDSGEAHYNLALALFALGASDQAREHFIEAANLAPGNQVIWDSPALRPFGSPDPSIAKKPMDYQGRVGQRSIGPGGGGS